jgi:hypothetical protein
MSINKNCLKVIEKRLDGFDDSHVKLKTKTDFMKCAYQESFFFESIFSGEFHLTLI